MQQLKMLLDKNSLLPVSTVSVVNKCFTYRLQTRRISHYEISDMIAFANTILLKYNDTQLPIVFHLGTATFSDKLTYILFECLCACLIEDYGYKVKVDFSHRSAIHTAGIKSSPLLMLESEQDMASDFFCKAFQYGLYNRKHYRRLLTREQICETNILCKMLNEIVRFQKSLDVELDCREAIAEVIVELVGNAGEHGKSDCLVDFDIAQNYRKRGTDGEYIGINIAVVDFSCELLGTSLKEKLRSNPMCSNRYEIVSLALQNQKAFFSDKYDEDDFFNITAFQHKISGRHDSMVVGGTGLTKLIQSLESRSDAHSCYVMSGDRQIWFEPDFLRYNEDGWIGFNASNDYVNCIPDLSIFERSKFWLPGTAYNLNFVMQIAQKGVNNE